MIQLASSLPINVEHNYMAVLLILVKKSFSLLFKNVHRFSEIGRKMHSNLNAK
jgi:hypothetical protein